MMSLGIRHTLKSYPNPSFLHHTYLEIEKDQCDNLRTTSFNLPQLLAWVLQTQCKPLLLRGSRSVSAMCSHSSSLGPPQTAHTFSLLGASSLMQCTAEVSACLKPTFVLSYLICGSQSQRFELFFYFLLPVSAPYGSRLVSFRVCKEDKHLSSASRSKGLDQAVHLDARQPWN